MQPTEKAWFESMECCCTHDVHKKRLQTLGKVPNIEYPTSSKISAKRNEESGHSPDNINMRVNDRFTESHVSRDTGVLGDQKYHKEQTAFIESQCTWDVSENYKSDTDDLGNKHFLVKNLTEDKQNKRVDSSRKIQQNSGVSHGSESLQTGSSGVQTNCNGNYRQLLRTEHLAFNTDSSLQNSHLSGDKPMSHTGTTRHFSAPCEHVVPTSKKSTSDDGMSCRICHSASDLENLVSPCLCTGSMKYVHESCLLNWLKSSFKTNCELCLHEVPVRKMVKPLREWRFLDEKPVAIIWLLSFLILLTLNILSVIKDASRGCTTTTCVVFYVLGCTGAILGVVFLWFWAKKSAVYFTKLLTLNQVWLLDTKRKQRAEKKPRTFNLTVKYV
ncbi:uncharacterized protein LOC114518248 isoform X1 [Dendronephthya gigantea]|uniref:uncharacterized protein LOC114518248 isoform X1 n=1 Tax=Dendronephthya gigantea TaxID=151771 RepID=UPI00106A6F83|nr:uncharacterized protein LOC114518248 isoform X1 [Dendronephthya gigantea]